MNVLLTAVPFLSIGIYLASDGEWEMSNGLKFV